MRIGKAGTEKETRIMLRIASPEKVFQTISRRIKKEWKIAFFACFLMGLLAHMPILLSDIPNHDGLDSMHFDQNMITSGRWFLTVACGFSSYYTLPWVIGLLGLVYLGLAAAALCGLLEIRKSWAAAACGGLLAVFPAIASTFAYVFTLDGYMLAVLLAVSAVAFTKKSKKGFLPGAVCLAFSMGIYQGYLSFAVTLSLFMILKIFAQDRKEGTSLKSGRSDLGGKIRESLHFLYMGVLGAGLYYGILQILLKLQGKELGGYQGIDGMVSGPASGAGILYAVVEMYRDFLSFTFRGNVLYQNIYGAGACILLAAAGFAGIFAVLKNRKCWKNPAIFCIMIAAAAMLPLAANIILLISPSVTYHLLMRYQWVLYPIGAVALAGAQRGREQNPEGRAGSLDDRQQETSESNSAGTLWREWSGCIGAFVLIFCFLITDNIAYSNLQKRYEKTYAYCIRLLDRIEQTEGYYPGIPIAMVGVVGEEQYPVTDLTGSVTANMTGIGGDSLLYRGDNYREFIKNYLGATLNILPAEAMAEMYYSDEYIDMDSFPGENSIRIIEGIMYIKTENTER